MPINQKGLAPIIIVVALLVLSGGIGGAYFLGAQTKATVPTPSLIASPTPSSTPTPAQTPVPSVSPSPQVSVINAHVIATPPVVKSPSPSVTNVTTTVKSIPVISTQGWQDVSYKGVSFKIPPETKFQESESGSEGLVMDKEKSYSNLTIIVTDYKGGSRREQYYQMYPYAKESNCHEIYNEAQFGSIKVLEIAIDVGWCQGGGGGTLAVVGNKLVLIPNLGYDPDTNVISRAEYNKAIISTLKAN